MIRDKLSIYYPVMDEKKDREFHARLIKAGQDRLPYVVAGEYQEEALYDDSTDRKMVTELQGRVMVVPALTIASRQTRKINVLKLTSEKPGGLGAISSRLHENKKKNRGNNAQPPWGRGGVKTYLAENYPIETLTFNAARVVRTRESSRDYPERALVLDLAQDEETTELFYEASEVCLKGLKGLLRREVTIEQSGACAIARINAQECGSAQLEAFENDVRAMMPVSLSIGKASVSYLVHD
jgi:hypothetical protein